LMLRSLLLLLCSLAAVLLFPALLTDLVTLLLAPALTELTMIRCSGLLMGRWMFLPGWPGRRRSWRR
jgi:hypothetical protein